MKTASFTRMVNIAGVLIICVTGGTAMGSGSQQADGNGRCYIVGAATCAKTSGTEVTKSCPDKPTNGSCTAGNCYANCYDPPASEKQCNEKPPGSSSDLYCLDTQPMVHECDKKGDSGACEPEGKEKCKCPGSLASGKSCGQHSHMSGGLACPATPTPTGGSGSK